MNLQYLKSFVKAEIEKKPENKSEILELYQLCLDEIEEGESETHEIELCINSIEEL
jgi:hypothetical protein